MYPIIWTPLINSMTNIGFSDIDIDGTNVTFSSGICGNNAIVGTGLEYPISDDDIASKGFSLSMFVKLTAGMTVFKYQAGTKILMGVMVDSMNMAIKYYAGSGDYITLFTMDCHDSVGKWISFVYTYDGNKSSYAYINGNYIASSNTKPFTVNTSDAKKFVFASCNLFNVKIYVGVISIRQITEDYYCLLAGYKFDGAGLTGDKLTECDYSGFLHDITFSKAISLTSTSSPVRPYSEIIPSNVNLVTEKASWDTFFVNFWIYPVSTTTASQVVFKYGTSLSVTVRYNSGTTPTVTLSISYSASSSNPTYHKTIQFSNWYMVSLIHDSKGFRAYINCEKNIDVVDTNSLSGSAFTLCAFNGAYSDFRLYLRTPSEEYIKWLYRASTLMDDKGTVCTGTVTEIDKSQLTFDNKNGFMSKSINISEGCTNAMKYDTVNKVLTIKDFIEF